MNVAQHHSICPVGGMGEITTSFTIPKKTPRVKKKSSTRGSDCLLQSTEVHIKKVKDGGKIITSSVSLCQRDELHPLMLLLIFNTTSSEDVSHV